MWLPEIKMSPRTRANAKSTATDVLIPEKLYFRIGEVSRLCNLPAYVLRFWETEFPQLKPIKSSTGQRMYRRKDVESVLRIKQLLYEEGFTIPGARQHLNFRVPVGAGGLYDLEVQITQPGSGPYTLTFVKS